MEVKLLSSTPLNVCSHAIRTCWQSHDKGDTDDMTGDMTGEKDKELIDRIGNKFKHASMLEMLQYHFDIQGISLSTSHQLVRHRAFTYAQQSSRYTLSRILKDVDEFTNDNINDYCYINEDNKHLTDSLVEQMNILLREVRKGYRNDDLKYLMPTAFKTQIIIRADGRNLQNFLALRSTTHAHYEIRELAYAIYDVLPEQHKYLFKDFVDETRSVV